MTDTRWTIKGREFLNCNCAYGCPCQFNALPTDGTCRGIAVIEITEGRHGDTVLDGLNIACILRWPGPIHEGGGEVVPIVDERADDQQREALLRIMSGLDTAEGATIFQVFAATFAKVHDPQFARIDVELDVDGRTARVSIPGLIEARGEPIRNPVTGEEHRALIEMPSGFEYFRCEVARGWSTMQGPIAYELADTHAHFNELHMTESGVVH